MSSSVDILEKERGDEVYSGKAEVVGERGYRG
jgi:hypothetical protein